MAARAWLVKTEPECFSIQDLAACPRQTTAWDGVRNYQARNFLREMRRGDVVLVHHSSAQPPAVVGEARVVAEAYADCTAWDPQNQHFDPKASPENPIWSMVDLRLEKIFARPLPLEALRSEPALAKMELLRRGSRLSVQPVTARELECIRRLAETPVVPRGTQARKSSAARRQGSGRAGQPHSSQAGSLAATKRATGKAARAQRPRRQSASR